MPTFVIIFIAIMEKLDKELAANIISISILIGIILTPILIAFLV